MIKFENYNIPSNTARILIGIANTYRSDFNRPEMLKYNKMSARQIYADIKSLPYIKDSKVETFIQPAIIHSDKIDSRDCDDKTLFLISWAIATGRKDKFLVGILAQQKEFSHISPFYLFKNFAIPFDATYPDKPARIGKLLFIPVKLELYDLDGNLVYYPIKETIF